MGFGEDGKTSGNENAKETDEGVTVASKREGTRIRDAPARSILSMAT